MKGTSPGLRLGIAGMLALMAACGGGGGGSDSGAPSPSPAPSPTPSPSPTPTPAPSAAWTTPPAPTPLPGTGTATSGIFRDANVQGMTYTTPTLNGETGADGRYQYVVGETVTFSVGGVELGSAPAQQFMTPMYLPTDLDSSIGTQIDHRLRFLQMLDLDGDPENGIEISAAVRDRAQSWAQVDFTTAPGDLPAALATIQADAQSADGTAHAIPGVDAARAHFARTLWCTYSGVYRGIYNGGGESGIVALVSYGPSLIHAVSYDISERSVTLFQNTTVPGMSLTPDFDVVEIGGSATIHADYDNANIITGNWQAGGSSGALLLSRSFSSASPVYRIAGSTFPAQLFVNLEIDASNEVTGIIVDLDVTGNGEPVAVTGTLSGSTLSVTTADNSFSITGGTFDTTDAPGTQGLTGTLRDNRHDQNVPLAVPGCRLN